MKQIKKTTFILLFCLFIFSCKKDNQRNSYNNLIIGKWNNLNIESAYKSPTSSDTSRHITYTFSKGEYIEFINDGTFVDYGGDYFYYAYTPRIRTGTYSIDGNVLYTKYDAGGNDTLQIQSITERKLTLYDIYPRRGGTQEHWTNFLR
jgi:hypothetical protein